MSRWSKPSTGTKPTLQPAINDLAALIRHHRLSYDQFRHVCIKARKLLDLTSTRAAKRLPVLLTEAELVKFFDAVTKGPVRDTIMLRLLYFTAVRVSELVNIKVQDVDWSASKIYIEQGKGGKDRYVLFDDAFKTGLRVHMEHLPHNTVYLFESAQRRHLTDRRVRQLVHHYAKKAGITKRVHPHLLRHQMLTFLTSKGINDAQIQLISGHSSKKSLEVYQHLSLSDVADDYQRAVKLTNGTT
jgi:integrase/recombinase XerD